MKNTFFKVRWFPFFLMLMAFTHHAGAQSLPTIKGVFLEPHITFDAGSGIFTYSYMVTNFPSSAGEIADFAFELYLPAGSPDPGAQGLQVPANMAALAQDRAFLGISKQQISVAFTQAPPGWAGFLTVDTPGVFSTAKTWAALIRPGEAFGPFVLQSRGPVGIRAFLFQPNEEPVKEQFLPEAEYPYNTSEVNQLYAKYNQVVHGVEFATRGLAPTALPQSCDPACMVQFLANEKEQAYKLGWIDNAGVANALDAKLNEAQKKLQAGETHVAINILKSFILDLEAQHQGQTGQGNGASKGKAQTSGKHVTDNAYYLLKPNAEFILYKLGATNIP